MKKALILLSMIASATSAHAALPCAAQVAQAVEQTGADVMGIETDRTGTFYRVYYMFDNGDSQTHGHIILAVNPGNCAVSNRSTWRMTN